MKSKKKSYNLIKKIAVVKLLGGLGNEMFQFSYGKYLKCNNINVYYDSTWAFLTNRELRITKMNIEVSLINRFFGFFLYFLNRINFLFFVNREKTSYSYQDFSSFPFVYYVGFWQHISYIKYNKSYLQKCFQYSINNYLIKDLISTITTNSVGIHVRRGDYVNNLLHETIGVKYFFDAIEYIRDKVKEPSFFIVSDDINWCKMNLIFENCTYIDFSKNEFEDFEVLKNCHHKIISNSSFSWWGAYLNMNLPNVYYPSKWFSDKKNSETDDLCPDHWIEI